MTDEANEGFGDFEDIDPDKLLELLSALGLPGDALDIPVGSTAGIQVRGLAGSASEILPTLMDEAGPDLVVSCLANFMGSMALTHSLDSGCDCGAEAHYDQIFEVLDKTIEDAKEALRPQYLETYEQEVFKREVGGDLEDLEVIPEDDLEIVRAMLAEANGHDEEE